VRYRKLSDFRYQQHAGQPTVLTLLSYQTVRLDGVDRGGSPKAVIVPQAGPEVTAMSLGAVALV